MNVLCTVTYSTVHELIENQEKESECNFILKVEFTDKREDFLEDFFYSFHKCNYCN